MLLYICITNEENDRDFILAAYTATHFSIRNVGHLNEILSQTMDTELRFHRIKCLGLIKNVIALCLLEDLVQYSQDAVYSLIIDESTDRSVIKYSVSVSNIIEKKEKILKRITWT